jgi:hypothetical protein
MGRRHRDARFAGEHSFDLQPFLVVEEWVIRPGTMHSGMIAEIRVPGVAVRRRCRRYSTIDSTMLRYGLGITTSGNS